MKIICLKSYLFKIILSLILVFSISNAFSQDNANEKANIKGDLTNGKSIFTANCIACHKLKGKLVGPGIGDVTSRRNEGWLKSWVKDNAKFRASGDKDAVAIFEEYNKIVMPSYSHLSDKDINDVIAYLDNSERLTKEAEAAANREYSFDGKYYKSRSQSGFSVSEGFMFVGIIVAILASLYLLYFSNFLSTLSIFDVKKAVNRNLPWLVGGILIVGLILLRGAWGWMTGVDVNVGYEPVQPIAFSHRIHAGDNKIDCQYCHSGAKHSRTSGIPSTNVCMNCHKTIQEGSVTGKKEIKKIYDAVGFDPATGEYSNKPGKPVKWVKVHNLADFVYYNHSQHVTVGKLECQECHGEVETMDVLRQEAPLTMGWCIGCHKKKGIDVDNPYYEGMHQELAKKLKVEKLTVSMIGGTECGKCHY